MSERKPRTQAQIDASRRNGARSRGPKTAEGKLRSSRNAMTHGLTGKTYILPGDDKSAFALLVETYRAQFGFNSEEAEPLIHEAAVAEWRQTKVRSLLAQCDAKIKKQGLTAELEHERKRFYRWYWFYNRNRLQAVNRLRTLQRHVA